MELIAIEHEPRHLVTKSVGEFNSQFRGEHARVFLCRFAEIAYTSVVLVAPRGHVFRAVQKYPVFDDAISAHTGSALISDERFYSKFINEFGQHGIASDLIPRGLFSPYDRFGGYGPRGACSPIGRKSVYGLALAGRVESAFVPNECVSNIVMHWSEQLEQFQELSFLSLDAATDVVTSNPAAGLDGASSLHMSARTGDFLALCANGYASPEEESDAMARLRELELAFRTNGSVSLSLLTGDYLKALPSLWLGKGELARERLMLRASILKHAKWVWRYSKSVAGIDDLESRLEAADMETRSAMQSALGDLRQFHEFVLSRYPIVSSNPIESCVAPFEMKTNPRSQS